MNSIKKILTDIKNNLSLILLLPAVLGGLWQLFELAKLSPSFIRFFSPTQLLPDGLLVLFILSFIYLALIIPFIGHKNSYKRKRIIVSTDKPSSCANCNAVLMTKPQKLAFVDNPIYNNISIYEVAFRVFVIIFWTYIVLYNLVLPIIKIEKITFSLFVIILFVLALYIKTVSDSVIILTVLAYNKLEKIFLKKPKIKEWILYFITLFSILLVIYLISISFEAFVLFHKKFMLPENLKNLDYISHALKNDKYVVNNISYFNDKYIFIKHISENNNTTIEVLKFDDLFGKE